MKTMKHNVVVAHTSSDNQKFNGEKVFTTFENYDFNPATEQFDMITFNAVGRGLGSSRNYESRHEAIRQLSKAHSCVVKSIEDISEVKEIFTEVGWDFS